MPIINLTSLKSFQAAEGISILEASIKSTVSLPFSCNRGRCSTCKCRVIKGETTALEPEIGLTEEDKREGWILSCVRTAKTDVVLDVEDINSVNLPLPKITPCRITDIEKLTSSVLRIRLRLPPRIDFSFFPGQYIDVIGPGGNQRSYSLANSNADGKLLELHIRAVDGGVMSDYWFYNAKINDLLRLRGPLGTFFLRPSAKLDLIFLATGTGFAPVKAILESLSNIPTEYQPNSVTVFWGGRKTEDLYLNIDDFQGNYRLIPVLSRSDENWTGAKGYVQQAAITMFPDLSNVNVYACGSHEMIRSANLLLKQAGLASGRFYSDAFVCSS
jgi:CDP-4-dehydro-6-deoxyglucose reductase